MLGEEYARAIALGVSITDYKMQKTLKNREALDLFNRKRKTVLALKPALLRSYREDALRTHYETKIRRHACRRFIALIVFMPYLKTLQVNFALKKEETLKFLRVLWLDIKISIYFKRKFKCRGCLSERFRSQIKQTLVFASHTFLFDRTRNISAEIIKVFLRETAKNSQFMIKLKRFHARMLRIQVQGKNALASKQLLLDTVSEIIVEALTDLRSVLLSDRKLKAKHAEVIKMINHLSLHKDKAVESTARTFLLLPSFVHTINLVRWYAKYRN